MNKFFLVNFLLACYSIFSSKKKTFCGFLFQILLVLASIITNIRAIVSNFFLHRQISIGEPLIFIRFFFFAYDHLSNTNISTCLISFCWIFEHVRSIGYLSSANSRTDRPFPKPINPASIGCILSCSVMIKCWLERNKTYWQFLNASKRMLHTWNSCKPKLLKL